MATVIGAPVETEMIRFQLVRVVTGRGGTLSVHGATDSCMDENEEVCVVVVGCRLFHVVTSSLESKKEEIQLVSP